MVGFRSIYAFDEFSTFAYMQSDASADASAGHGSNEGHVSIANGKGVKYFQAAPCFTETLVTCSQQRQVTQGDQ